MNRSGASGVMVMVTGEEGGIQRVTALGLAALKQQVGGKGGELHTAGERTWHVRRHLKRMVIARSPYGRQSKLWAQMVSTTRGLRDLQ